MQFYLSEFHKEAFRKGMKEEGYEEAVIKYIQKSQANGNSADNTIAQVIEFFDLSEEEATTLVNEHWMEL